MNPTKKLRLLSAAVYPNPVNGGQAGLALELEGAMVRAEVDVYTRAMQKVLQVAVEQAGGPGWTSVSLPTDGLASGTYFLRVRVWDEEGGSGSGRAVCVILR